MSDTQHVKVFISHASEDKDRFVTGFATKLRAFGLDAWYDLWEIGPGDRAPTGTETYRTTSKVRQRRPSWSERCLCFGSQCS